MSQPEGLWALLIGVDHYLPHRLPGGGWYPDLAGCVRDVSHMATFLRSRLALPEDRILTLTASRGSGTEPAEEASAWPTYENIVARFGDLTSAAKPGDAVLIHYSGHGGRTRTAYPDLKGPGGLDEALVPTDIGNEGARYVRDLELMHLLKAMVDRGLLVTVVLDCCHSGGATRGMGTPVARGIAEIDESAPPTDSLVATSADLATTWAALQGVSRSRALKPASGWVVEAAGYTLLAACRANEKAYEDCFDGRERNGALTYWLLDSLRAMGQGTTYKVLHDRLLAKIRGWNAAQTPQLQGEADRVVFGADTITSVFAIPVLRVAGDRVALNAGEAHGVRVGSLVGIYPRGATDLAVAQGRVALAEVTELAGDADCWATITEHATAAPVEVGAQAVILGSADLRFQHAVGLSVDDPLLRQRLAVGLETQGAGFVRVANAGEAMAFQVAVGDDGLTIWDGTGEALPNAGPAIGLSEPTAVDRVIGRLVHLAKFRNVQALDNPAGSLRGKLALELVPAVGARVVASGETVPTFRPDQRATLRIRNLLAPNPNDMDDETRIMNVAVLALGADWSISQLYPTTSASAIVQPDDQLDVPLETYLPAGVAESVDVLKVFATQRTTDFRWLSLPALDQPPVDRSALDRTTRSAITDPLQALMTAITGEVAPPAAENRYRGVKLYGQGQVGNPWTVAHVELRVQRDDSDT